MPLQVIVKTSQLLTIIFMIALYNMNVVAFDTFPNSSVVLKLKVYLGDKSANNDVADSVDIKVVEINSLKEHKHFKKSGLFNMKLDLGKHFLIYVSKGGYETHFFEFSTLGVEPEMNLVFYVDITLSQGMEFENRLTGLPSNHLKYDSVEKDKYINISRGTSITFDNKSKN